MIDPETLTPGQRRRMQTLTGSQWVNDQTRPRRSAREAARLCCDAVMTFIASLLTAIAIVAALMIVVAAFTGCAAGGLGSGGKATISPAGVEMDQSEEGPRSIKETETIIRIRGARRSGAPAPESCVTEDAGAQGGARDPAGAAAHKAAAPFYSTSAASNWNPTADIPQDHFREAGNMVVGPLLPGGRWARLQALCRWEVA